MSVKSSQKEVRHKTIDGLEQLLLTKGEGQQGGLGRTSGGAKDCGKHRDANVWRTAF